MFWLVLALALRADPIVIDGVDVAGWTTRQLWARSDDYYHAGKFAESVHLLQRVISLDPGDVEAYSVAAWLTWSLGDEPAARRYVQEAVRANPNSSEAHFELGQHLFDRANLPAAAAASLRRAYELPGCRPPVARLLAHALCYAERPNEAVALWGELAARGLAAPGLAEPNRVKALGWALRSDLLARHDGVTSGPAPAGLMPLRDTTFDDNGDGWRERRVLELALPERPHQVAARVAYVARRVVHKAEWRWLTMVADGDGDGSCDRDTVLLDSDGDGSAESLPPLAELRRQFATRAAHPLGRFLAPDRYELEVDATGWARLASPRVEAERLTFAPAFVVASESPGLALRLLARALPKGGESEVARVALPAGVYAGNDGDERYALTLARVALAAPGAYALALEILRDGVRVDRKASPAWTVELTAAGLRPVAQLSAVANHADSEH